MGSSQVRGQSIPIIHRIRTCTDIHITWRKTRRFPRVRRTSSSTCRIWNPLPSRMLRFPLYWTGQNTSRQINTGSNTSWRSTLASPWMMESIETLKRYWKKSWSREPSMPASPPIDASVTLMLCKKARMCMMPYSRGPRGAGWRDSQMGMPAFSLSMITIRSRAAISSKTYKSRKSLRIPLSLIQHS